MKITHCRVLKLEESFKYYEWFDKKEQEISKLKIDNLDANKLELIRLYHEKDFELSNLPDRLKSIEAWDYLSDILINTNLYGLISEYELNKFYEHLSLDDLCQKYTGKHISARTEFMIRAQERAFLFENKCEVLLRKMYKTVLPQAVMSYKLNDSKLKFCIPDFICSNEKEVIIYECKSNKKDIIADQNDLYLSCVNFLVRDGRKVYLKNIVMNENYSIFDYPSGSSSGCLKTVSELIF